MTINKQNLRKIALKKRNILNIDSISAVIVNRIINSFDFINAKNIALYFPIKNEVDITAILKSKNKNFYFPCCNGNNLEFKKYSSNVTCISGLYNIKEPMGCAVNVNKLDIIYIPSLMANRLCYRLGYGKGYYDRFFNENKINAKKILVIPHELISDDFIQDDYDYKMDEILSEKEIIC